MRSSPRSRPLSLAAGAHLDVAVSASQPLPVTWAVYRIGWYHGAGARKLAEGGPVTVTPQPAPYLDPATGLVECRWSSTVGLSVGDDWVSGLYVMRIQAPDGGARYAPFIVKDTRHADLIAVFPTATEQAYNTFGGESLYTDSRYVSDTGNSTIRMITP